MKRSLIVAAAALAFVVGLSVSPAFAGSYPSNFAKVFGHSTSCALGRASTNDTTERAGALTNNYAGCSSSNAHRNVPVKYLGARAFVLNSSNGAVCGASDTAWNTSTTWTRDASTAREYTNTSCASPRNYFGVAWNYRKSDDGNLHLLDDRYAPYRFFSSYLT